MITIVDYGLGNILAFANVFKQLGVPFGVATKPAELIGATKIILPGVGAFDHAMERIDSSGMREILDELVLQESVPVIGICVGMQILAGSSDEGQKPGLGWIRGHVRKFDVSNAQNRIHLPHMGWNDVSSVGDAGLFNNLESDSRFYFLHSYYFECDDEADVIATSDYSKNFCCALKHKNIYGVQFHPEKSHHYGLQLLKNFADI